ncbi:MAG: Gp19/Gp15/Gp42 family protein [Propionibacteriaceae bacterium]|nr:Gp19/Gp15/Gp42 family protein [Propionibacteriaceae bacterium]
MLEPFADTVTLEAAWRPLSEAETQRATYLLAKASRELRALAPTIDARIEAGSLDPDLVADVVCAMVQRVMESAEVQLPVPGLETWQTSVGPFQDSFKFSSPTGNMYLTKAEKRLLGIGAQVAAMVPMYRVPEPPPIEEWVE